MLRLKYIFIGIIFIISSLISKAQDYENMNGKIDSLKETLENIRSDIQFLSLEEKKTINQIKLTQKQKVRMMSGKTYRIVKAPVVDIGAILRDTPKGNELTKVSGGDTVIIYAIDRDHYFEVRYNDFNGYISHTNIERTPEVEKMLAEDQQKRFEMIEKNDPKYARLSNIYGKDLAMKLVNQNLWKGMSHGMVMESLGNPLNTSQQNTSWGMRETWLYDDKDLIFLNGELTSWRDKNK